jgi:NitT/TauT family transport system permease protein
MSVTTFSPRRRSTHMLDSLAIIAVIVVLWQVLFFYAGDVAITSPIATLRFAIALFASATFWPHAAATMLAFAYALVISAVLGVALGLWLGLRRFAGDVAEPILASLYTIPKVTLYPVMLLLFGLGLSAKVAFGVIHGLIPIVLFTLSAVKNVPQVYLRSARALRLTPLQTATSVLIPAVTPEIVSGLRIGFSTTLLGVLIGEMFASQRGLGFLIINGIEQHNVRMTTAVTLIVILFSIVANTLLLTLDRRIHHGG